jgi:hypothetical protein
MRHDITDCEEGTGAGRGPGVLWQAGQVLLQPLEHCLDDFDTFCLRRHGFSLRAVASVLMCDISLSASGQKP